MIFKRYGDSGFTLDALFLSACLPLILGAETVAPFLISQPRGVFKPFMAHPLLFDITLSLNCFNSVVNNRISLEDILVFLLKLGCNGFESVGYSL